MGNVQTSTALPQLSPNEAQEDAPDCSGGHISTMIQRQAPSGSIVPEQVALCQFGKEGGTILMDESAVVGVRGS